MKNIYNKIYIKKDLLILFFLAFISGLFKEVLTFFLIIVIHEMGHLSSSFIYKWNIKRISFGIEGGFITYEENIDKPFKEEFLISISGFIFQILFYLITYFLYSKNLVNSSFMFLVKKYNYSILIFNLLPIVPLDGYRIINIILNMYIPYSYSLKISGIISFFSMLIIIFLFLFFKIKLEISYIILFIFLIKKIINYFKDIPYLFNKFLIERYINKLNAKKIILIKGYRLDKLRRQKRHLFIIGKKSYTERQILSKKFD